jgi:hypothetical protein
MCADGRIRTVETMNERHLGVCGWAVAIAAGVIFGGLALSAAFWVLGLVFHAVFWAFRAVLVLAIVAAVVWMVDRRRANRYVS